MRAAGCAWIAFQRIQLPVRGLNEIEGNLPCKIIFSYKSFHPVENDGMFHMFKNYCRALSRREVGWIRGVRVYHPIMTNRVGAVGLSIKKFLRDPGQIKIQRG